MSAIKITAQPEKYCPPCGYFEPEIIEKSCVWGEKWCDSSLYILDCVHREVCGIRAKSDEYMRGYEDGLRQNTSAAFAAAKQAFGVVEE